MPALYVFTVVGSHAARSVTAALWVCSVSTARARIICDQGRPTLEGCPILKLMAAECNATKVKQRWILASK
ncbi:hypothetical protein [Saccharothrix syringae]|uniref:hypothetical protein n=1 Tax=Saccharothrix syringae TaxID=103733 RepID=UPI000526C728|nr:hypothetical protein [Saccharothrix syringae]